MSSFCNLLLRGLKKLLLKRNGVILRHRFTLSLLVLSSLFVVACGGGGGGGSSSSASTTPLVVNISAATTEDGNILVEWVINDEELEELIVVYTDATGSDITAIVEDYQELTLSQIADSLNSFFNDVNQDHPRFTINYADVGPNANSWTLRPADSSQLGTYSLSIVASTEDQIWFSAIVTGQIPDIDNDRDTISVQFDNCPSVANQDQLDTDNDNIGDACDTDIDGDGVFNVIDNCPLIENAGQEDIDNNDIGDICDDDIDGDGTPNPIDNCPTRPNTDQLDFDTDNFGDACDPDSDNDGLIDITTAEELYNIRHSLDGTAKALVEKGEIIKINSGCGDGIIIRRCNGYELLNDIDLIGYTTGEGWEPIAPDIIDPESGASTLLRGNAFICNDVPSSGVFKDYSFNVEFNGNGYTISNLKINRPGETCIGLFGLVGQGAKIHNLKIEADEIRGNSHIGVLAGYVENADISSVEVVANNIGGAVNEPLNFIFTRQGQISNTTGEGRSTNFCGVSRGRLLNQCDVTVSQDRTQILVDRVTTITNLDNTILSRTSEHRLISICPSDAIQTTCQLIDTSTGDYANFTYSYDISAIAGRGSNYPRSTRGDLVGGLVGVYSNPAVTSTLPEISSVSAQIGSLTGKDQLGGIIGKSSEIEVYNASSIIDNLHALNNSSSPESISGGLIGRAEDTPISYSSARIGSLIGREHLGGLIGETTNIRTTEEYVLHASSAVSGFIHGTDRVGGLIGNFESSIMVIIDSYAITQNITGNNQVGGLIGYANNPFIVSSYAITNNISGQDQLGGLVGYIDDDTGGGGGETYLSMLLNSYAVTGNISADTVNIGGLLGGTNNINPSITIDNSYWDNNSLTVNVHDADRGKDDLASISGPWNFNSLMPSTINDFPSPPSLLSRNTDRDIYCDNNRNNIIDNDERHADNIVWHFNSTTADYPAIRCTPDTLSDQRSWWSLVKNRPQLNTAKLEQVTTLP